MSTVGPVVRDVVGTLARLGLAAVWLVSGVPKALDPEQTFLAVQAYDVLPNGLVSPVATVLPFLEIALAALLLAGFGTRPVAMVSAVVLLAFVAGITQAWARGLTIDCGCFGGGGLVEATETRYPQELARDTGFLLLAAWLVVRPRTLFALDNALAGPADDEPDDEPDEDDGAAERAEVDTKDERGPVTAQDGV